MTEQEAREKWCPQMTHCDNPHLVEVGASAVYVQDKCCASSCMAWRWAESTPCRDVMPARDPHAATEPDRPEHLPASWQFCPCDDASACWVEPAEEAAARRSGYCGLAGKP